MKKVSIIGAGNVGATAAMNIARMGIVDTVVLLDIKEGIAEGKAIDIAQTLGMVGISTNVIGVTNDYKATQESDVYVITSGIPRKPGMTREELVGVNNKVINSVMDGITAYCYDHISEYDEMSHVRPKFVVVSNPVDTMCSAVLNYLVKKYPYGANTFNDSIIGFGGLLDSNRFKYYIKLAFEKKYDEFRDLEDHVVDISNINAYVIGGHGDKTMIPVWEHAQFAGMPIDKFFKPEEINEIVENTMKGGATLTSLIGTSAWEAPGMGIAITVKAIVNNENKIIPSSVWSNAYKCFIGQLPKIGEDGVCDVFYNYELIERVQKELFKSANAIKSVNEALKSE